MKRVRPATSAIAIASAFLLAWSVAHAERPMTVDDAGTLDKGGAKVELGWVKDDKAKGFDGAVGYAPIDDLELELGFGRVRDHAPSPYETVSGLGAAVKWVPYRNETGPSAGLKYEYAHEEVRDGAATNGHSLLLLLSWAFDAGPIVHVNLGRDWLRSEGRKLHSNLWGIGVDWPVTAQLSLTLETYGAEHEKPEQAVGVRYEVFKGLKISGAIGQGSDRTIANAGMTWEF